jgi:hypothetical protein
MGSSSRPSEVKEEVVIKFLIHLSKWAAACVITALLASAAISRTGPEECEVVVHVGASDVEVQIDGLRFTIDHAWGAPVICELPPGLHTLTMVRDGGELYHEEFRLERGKDRVLTAWDQQGLLQTGPNSPSPSAPELAKNERLVSAGGSSWASMAD